MFGMSMSAEDVERLQKAQAAASGTFEHVEIGMYFGRPAIVHKPTKSGLAYITNDDPRIIRSRLAEWENRFDADRRKARGW